MCEACGAVAELIFKIKSAAKDDPAGTAAPLAQLAKIASEGYDAKHTRALAGERVLIVPLDLTLLGAGSQGAVPVLVPLLRSKHDEIVQNAGTVLYNMMRVFNLDPNIPVDNTESVIKADGIPAFAKVLISSKSAALQALAASALELVALEEEGRRLLVAKQEGVIQRAADLATKSGDPNVVLACVDVLRACSQTINQEVIKVIAKAAPKAIVKATSVSASKINGETLKIAGSGAMACTNLAQKSSLFRANIAQEGGIEKLVSILKMAAPSNGGEEVAALVDLLHLTSAIALGAIGQSPSNAERVADAGAIGPTLGLLTSSSDEAKYGALTLLVVLAQSWQVKPKIADAGGIPAVYAIAQEWTELKPMAILVLIYMAEHPGTHDRLFATRVHQMAKEWLDRDPTLQMFGCLLLGHMAQTAGINKQITTESFRPLLTVTHSRDATVKFCALYAMAALHTNEPGKSRTAEREIEDAWQNITKEPEVNCGQFYALRVLSPLLKTDNKNVRLFVAWTYSVLSGEVSVSGGGTDRGYKERRSLSITERPANLRADGRVRRGSVHRMRLDSVGSVNFSSNATGHLPVEEDLPMRFFDQNLIPILLELVDAPEVEVARFGLKSISNLTLKEKYAKRLAVNSDVKPMLDKKVKSQDEAVHAYAGSALKNLKKVFTGI